MSATYRYKFSSELGDALSVFAQANASAPRHEYKAAFERWTTVNESLIKDEVVRLTGLGFTGDAVDRMYKSARYYYCREKSNPEKLNSSYKTSKRVLAAMDEHIRSKGRTMKPSVAFDDFFNKNNVIVRAGGENANVSLDNDDVIRKLKKTYKNRYNRDINGHQCGADTEVSKQ
jgi:hypothetical protein